LTIIPIWDYNGTHKKKKKPRTIQIPEWVDAAVSELAVKDKRSVSGEIEFLVEAAMRHITEERVSELAQAVPEADVNVGRLHI
jgi:hypothetical protein